MSRVYVNTFREGTYLCKLSDETMKKARKELGEDEKDRASKIQTVREWIKTHPYITSRTDDEFILRFLRVSKFRVMEAQQRIEKFCITRTSQLEGCPEWFGNQDEYVDDEDIKDMLNRGFQVVLPRPKDQPEGPVYILGKTWDITTQDGIDKMMRALMMSADTNMMDPNIQIHGACFIQDMAGYSLEMLKLWSNDNMRKTIKAWQDAYPARTKQLNHLNMPGFFNAVMELVKLFLKKKLQERMYFHSNQKCLLKNVPKECLPEEYGGTAGKLEDLIAAYRDKVLSNKQEYELLKQCWVNEDKMPREIPEGDSWGMVGSYRKLET